VTSWGQGFTSLFDATSGQTLLSDESSLNKIRAHYRVSAPQRLLITAAVGADFITSIVAVFAAYGLVDAFTSGHHFSHSLTKLLPLSSAVGILVTLTSARDNVYSSRESILRVWNTERALRASCAALLLLLATSIITGHFISVGTCLCAAVLLPAFLLMERYFFSLCTTAARVCAHGTPPALFEGHPRKIFDEAGLLPASVSSPAMFSTYLFFKKLFDFFSALLLLVFFLPLALVLAVLICLDSPGPAFFRQERVGKDARRFQIVKFRTMYTGTPKYAISPSTPLDVRVTRVGRLLRKTSLDELPQLWNVLCGDMSLVGPRPEMPFLVEHYDFVQKQRLQATPGITGLWQLSADRAFSILENPEYDTYYIRHRGIFLDGAILLHTVLFAMRGI
jgi:lipopolysaccharide/colanic/teichoic acid biosynthesis glycosyltransferase